MQKLFLKDAKIIKNVKNEAKNRLKDAKNYFERYK